MRSDVLPLSRERPSQTTRSVDRAHRTAARDHLSLWIYSYSRGVSSARAIERLCEHDPAYQWLTGMEGISAHTRSGPRAIVRITAMRRSSAALLTG